jgi:glycosyltransferase involved in cell wall biosynthesis
MKNILVIAYYFPPSGGPGVQRVLKHVKYLREFGWNPIVFTVKNAQYPAYDYSLMKEIPDDVKVYKSQIFEPYDIYRFFTGKKKNEPIDVNTIKKEGQSIGFKEKIAEFIRATFFIPDARIGWYFSSKKVLKEIFQKENIQAIYSSSPPYTCSLIAQYSKKKLKVPWIAGFRDPWTDFISSPKRWFFPKFIDKSLEKSTFANSDLVECAWEGIIKDAINKYPKINKEKFIHNPNGFDSADYPDFESKRNSKFTLTYTGSMYGRRNPQALFLAIEQLLSENRLHISDFQINLIGRFGSEIHEMINKTTFQENIHIINYIPHHDSLIQLLKSDALLLIVDESKESSEIVPGKVYEYLGTLKPLLVISPTDGAIAKLIYETGSGLVAHQSQIDLIADNFEKLFNLWKNNLQLNSIKPVEIKKYERRESAKKLANMLDNLINNQ